MPSELMRVFWNIGEVAAAVAALDAPGPLPLRTVIIPNGRTAHAVRKELVQCGLSTALNGTRFATSAALAAEVLEECGIAFTDGEDARRAPRLGALFREGLDLRHFDERFLREAAGWDEAFAQTISDLEEAGLTAALLAESALDDRERDLAIIWEALDRSAAESWTEARILREATARAGSLPAAPALAILTGGETGVVAAFLRARSATSLAFLGARPLTASLLERMGALWGEDAASTIHTAAPPRPAGSRSESLAAWMFEDVEIRSTVAPLPPDPSLSLEEHPGADEEIEAAVDWVGREILTKGTPLGEIALLVPEPDPVASMLVARLARLPWPSEEPPVYVAGGLPITFRGDGAQAIAAIHALSEGLPGERLVDLLPGLRMAPTAEIPGQESPWPTRLSRNQAIRVLVAIGAFGATAVERSDSATFELARPGRVRLAERIAELETSTQHEPANARQSQAFDEDRRLLGLLRGVRPALEAVFELGEEIRDGGSLEVLARSTRRFVKDWLFTPAPKSPSKREPNIADRLAPAFASLVSADSGLTGRDAMRALEAAARFNRIPYGRFGTPLVYVGTIRDAIGLSFRSIRVLGLCEGAFPRSIREDAILPDASRRRIHPAVSLANDRPSSDARALHRVLLDASAWSGSSVVLSTPRVDVNGTTHEPSSLFLEAATALEGGAVPDLRALRTRFFGPAAEAREAGRLADPLWESARLHRASRSRIIPSSWTGESFLDLARIETLTRGTPQTAGMLDEEVLPLMRGLDGDRPISASDLRELLECPQRFLQERILRRRKPDQLPSVRDIGMPRYGTLYHQSIELFFREHAQPFSERQHRLARLELLPPFWEDRGRETAQRVIEAFVRWFPLDEAARDGYLLRLQSAVVAFLRHEWEEPSRMFVGGERDFGYEAPFSLEIDQHRLFLRGVIDRIDRESESTLIRDFKTGTAHRREGRDAPPTTKIDLQLAVYILVAREHVAAWGISPRVEGAFSYAASWGVLERAFREDVECLLESGRRWLGLAARLLGARAFPRTPDPKDCTYCSFRPVCGTGAQASSRLEMEAAPPGPLADLLRLKTPQA